jgi:hypothetical protein
MKQEFIETLCFPEDTLGIKLSKRKFGVGSVSTVYVEHFELICVFRLASSSESDICKAVLMEMQPLDWDQQFWSDIGYFPTYRVCYMRGIL